MSPAAVLVDCEFHQPKGEPPRPICYVAKTWPAGVETREWLWDRNDAPPAPPFPMGRETIYVAFEAAAELTCHLALGWRLPPTIIDLRSEFRTLTNQRTTSAPSLLGALVALGLPARSHAEKDDKRGLAIRGGPFTAEEQRVLMDYCADDVADLERLWEAMLPHLDLPYAQLRGRYSRAQARMEFAGVPIDVPTHRRLLTGWEAIQDRLIADIDGDYHVFDGRSFNSERFAELLVDRKVAWPRLESGAFDMSDDAFKERARAIPWLSPLRELRQSLSQFRLNGLTIGADGRNRTKLWSFGSATGRNAPSNSEYIFGPSVWLRSLIQPAPGRAISYVDWSQQEIGVAAALSGDRALQEAYQRDPYLDFAIRCGAAPPDATKDTHGTIRDLYKTVVLGVGYGMGAASLASRIGQPPIVAVQMLKDFRRIYRRYWEWQQGAIDHARLYGHLHTVFDWQSFPTSAARPTSLGNWPTQSHGAELLRLACSLATERGVSVVAPVHDAMMIDAPEPEIERAVAVTQKAMADASDVVLDGFPLRSDAKVVVAPERYSDPRGVIMWQRVMRLLDEQQVGVDPCAPVL